MWALVCLTKQSIWTLYWKPLISIISWVRKTCNCLVTQMTTLKRPIRFCVLFTGYEVVSCKVKGTRDDCRKCDNEDLQLKNVSSFNIEDAKCFKVISSHDQCPIYGKSFTNYVVLLSSSSRSSIIITSYHYNHHHYHSASSLLSSSSFMTSI